MFEMKDLCEKFFCFWRNWCKRPKESLVSIESSKLLENQKEAEHYSNITSSPQQIENTTFKEKKEIEMSTALPLEEDTNTIFPQKYMNNTETSPNFKSIFTREKMINFIEELINDKTTFTPLINKNGFDIYIRESGSIFSSQFPMIKMYYKIPKSAFTRPNVTVKLIDEYMNEPEKRLKFDNTIRTYKIIERINKEVYLLHYICKSPMFFVSERDVVDKRYDFYEGDVYYDFSSSTKDDLIPLDESIVRVADHCSVCKMFEDKDGFNIISITQVDTKVSLPPAVMNSQLPTRYKDWYDALVNEINKDVSK
jgi:hypothetical protein